MEQTPLPPEGRRQTSWLVILIVLVILAGFGLTAFFGVRALHSYRQLHLARLHPNETDVNLIRGWMTLPYIARAYRVPESVLWQELGIPEHGNRAKSLRALDRQYAAGKPELILTRVKDIISQYKSQHPGSPGLPTPTVPTGTARLDSACVLSAPNPGSFHRAT